MLVVDQFEECWSLAGEQERDEFLATLSTVATSDEDVPVVRVVVTIRADLYDRPLRHAVIGRLVADATFAVPAMTPAQLAEAIVGPAARTGATFDEVVVATMIDELALEPARCRCSSSRSPSSTNSARTV